MVVIEVNSLFIKLTQTTISQAFKYKRIQVYEVSILMPNGLVLSNLSLPSSNRNYFTKLGSA